MHHLRRLQIAVSCSLLILFILPTTNSIHLGNYRRHRRQNGAHLYLPESFILPGGDGNPAGWGEWGSPSECSRSCGGGVSVQTRECHDLDRNGQPLCTGGNKKFLSCNTQDCPEGEPDFRAQQCAHFDNKPFEGVRYEWVPYKKAPNPCELNCMPRGERFYYRHKLKVIDGTRCNDESLDVCVDGKCQPVGCDMMLGSSAKEDLCRKCGGDGSSCKTNEGIIDMDNLQAGYNDLLLIPAGATNIVVKEISPSNNYLAIRNLTGHYYLNGNWRIDFPRPLQFANSLWIYERKPQGFAAPDHISCVGPTSESVFIQLLLQDRNVGIKYQYSIPEAQAKIAEPDSYSWTHTDFGPCSSSCGGGYQSRDVMCNSRLTLAQVDDSLCDPNIKPANRQKCGQGECPARWSDSEWSKCSSPCGEEGNQTREIHCERVNPDGSTEKIDESTCLDLAGNKPATFKSCLIKGPCPQWYIGKWQSCDKLCGEGTQKRRLTCYQKENGKTKVLSEKECGAEKPEETRSCILRPCEGVEWITSSWSGCDSCGLKEETRTIQCANKNGKIYNETFCSSKAKPELTRECEETVCDFQWFSSQWSKCSSKCGKGIQTRTVLCGSFQKDKVVKSDDESKCDKDEKPEDKRDCENKNDCKGEWFSGPWSECSKKCGGGTKTRKVLCLENGQQAKADKCDVEKIELTSEDCNKDPCSEDETVPLDATSTTISDYDDEEWCDDEEEGDSEEDEDGILSVQSELTTSFAISDGIDLSSTDDQTESTLITDEVMMSDSTGFETETTVSDDDEGSADGSVSPSMTTEGSGDDEDEDEDETTTSSSDSATEESTSEKLSSESSTDSTSDSSDSSSSTESSGSSESDSSTVASSDSTTDAISTTTDAGSTITDSTTDGSTESSSDASTESTTDFTSESTTIDSSTTDSSTDITSTTDDITSTTDSATELSTTTDSVETTTDSVETTTDSGIASSTSDSISTTDASSTESVTTSDTSTDASSSTDAASSTDATTDSSGSTDSSTDVTGSTDASTEDSSTIESSTDNSQSTDSSDATTESGMTDETTVDIWSSTQDGSPTSTDEDEDSSSTPNTLEAAISKETEKPKKCKPRPKVPACAKSTYGCCPDNSTAATGPFEEGCKVPETCKDTKYGCCPDEITPAQGKKNKGCPEPLCKDTLFGCCSDGVTIAENEEKEGCPVITTTAAPTTAAASTESLDSRFGPEQSPAKPTNCRDSEFGCCNDGRTPATGPNRQGCSPCANEPFGCCPDGTTPAHGWSGEGCCLESQFGCCPDNLTPARGPQLEGCGCEYALYGCCPDNKTASTGHEFAGCSCDQLEFGCCPDNITPAKGRGFEGCPCHSFQFGCCPDGITVPSGPHNYGCHCSQTEHKCCSDGVTPALGPNMEGCTCATSKYGCCHDGITEANGTNFEGCEDIPKVPQKACGQPSDAGNCTNFSVKFFFDNEYGSCSRFWYGSCGGNDNRFNNEAECNAVCVEPQGKDKCLLPKVKGPCNGYYTSYYYDSDRNSCSQFIYGGCLGNNNRFETVEECQKECVRDESLPPCDQPVERGPCNGNYPRWAFNKETSQCEQFSYGGCKGNKNNYVTEASCNYHCKKPGVHKESCDLPKETGNCGERHAKWYFSSSDNKCMPFYYSGCEGNENNYGSKPDCETSCPPKIERDLCSLPAEVGDCQNYITRWYFDTKERRCRQFYYGSCGGNGNNFMDEQSCMARCEARQEEPPKEPEPEPEFQRAHCLVAPDAGPCRAMVESYYYNTRLGVCEMFLYGGCGGNPNRFSSIQECENKCNNVQDQCSLPPVYGQCHENETRWHYDSRTGRCEEFTFSGCRGNGNNFYNQRECYDACAREDDREPEPELPVCEQPMEPGLCEALQPMYYYNKERQSCEHFYYGGCGGNQNRFPTQDACEQQCVSKAEDPCILPPIIGDCGNGSNWYVGKRYFYDDSRGACLQFIYSGCGGNANNFQTMEECSQKCSHRVQPEQTDKCMQAHEECLQLHCPYGIGRSYDENGCQKCECEDPCRSYSCPSGTKCIVDIQPDPELGSAFVPSCRPIVKKGQCPKLGNSTNCEIECYSDADCRGDNKCCSAGCASICVMPDEEHVHTQRPPVAGVEPPKLEEKQPEEIDVDTPEGGIATLRCFATGYPLPTITWRLGSIVINTNQGRFTLTSSGDLQIVQVHRSDSGTYVCVADNGYGAPVERTIELVVKDPVQKDVYIVGDSNTTKIVELGQPADIRCLAGGFPKPTISWWRGSEILPFQSSEYEIRRDYSLLIKNVKLTDLGPYTCQAYAGRGKPVSLTATLRAIGPVYPKNAHEQEFLRYIVDATPLQPVEPIIPPVVVQPTIPLLTHITMPRGDRIAPGSDITLNCEVKGYPEPQVHWYKDDTLLVNSKRVQVNQLATELYQLQIFDTSTDDSGIYRCEARNRYSTSAHSEQIHVEGGTYVPAGCVDNQFFANCNLIVMGRYCNHEFYSKACCKSCTLAGQLQPNLNLV